MARVFWLAIGGMELVGKVGERATGLEQVLEGVKDSIAIKGEIIDDGLSKELALVMGVASVELGCQLGTIIRMRMNGRPDRTVTRCSALISLDTVNYVSERISRVILWHIRSSRTKG